MTKNLGRQKIDTHSQELRQDFAEGRAGEGLKINAMRGKGANREERQGGERQSDERQGGESQIDRYNRIDRKIYNRYRVSK